MLVLRIARIAIIKLMAGASRRWLDVSSETAGVRPGIINLESWLEILLYSIGNLIPVDR